MNRICCLVACLTLSGWACAEEAELLRPLPFSQGSDSLTSLMLPMDDIVAAVSGADNDLASQPRQGRDRRSATRERVLEALGVSRYIPNGHFTAFGKDGRWSLSLHDEDSVVLRMRIRW